MVTSKSKNQPSKYGKQAEDFLTKFKISFTATYAGNACPPFCDGKHIHGYRYSIDLRSLGRTTLTFDFWNSYADTHATKHNAYHIHNNYHIGEPIPLHRVTKPSAYDVLCCIGSDIHTPETFQEFCNEFGYDTDSRKAFTTFELCLAQSKKYKEFFTKKEIEALSEIR